VSADGRVAASLERMRDGGISPKRELGQNFLIDANLLSVVSRAADVGPADVVLEVGGGLGILSEHLAAICSHLHVIELDRGLEAALQDALSQFDNTTLHFGDALQMDLSLLDPVPNKLVANLPYGIAAPLILDSMVSMPTCTTWVAMIQREVGERLAAVPGTKAYGAPSALAQSCCEVKVVRAVSRTVFRPVPHVDSVIVRLDRTGPTPSASVRDLIHAGFAHRRKALAKSLSLAAGRDVRGPVREALEEMGVPADVRAERLSPAQFSDLAERIDWGGGSLQ
jgi:16S rRNA (adenine1518-N6/adenine1519-N6)-dimethyltransferase